MPASSSTISTLCFTTDEPLACYAATMPDAQLDVLRLCRPTRYHRRVGGAAMDAFICRRCGVQYAPTESPPASCPICEDERETVAWDGQQWTTLAELIAEGRRNHVSEEEPGLFAIDTRPAVAIGQRALLVQTPHGNVMWDCVSLVDESSIQRVR